MYVAMAEGYIHTYTLIPREFCIYAMYTYISMTLNFLHYVAT